MKRTVHRAIALLSGLALCWGAAPALAQGQVSGAAASVPVFGSVSPTSGSSSGGTTVTITGRHLDRVTAVKIGGSPATSLQVQSGGSRLTAVTPAGLPGSQPIALVSSAGKSAITSSSVFRFSDQAASSAATYTPQSSTVVGTDVEWVTGGTDHVHPEAGTPDPWVVAIGTAGALPEVGDHYFLAPGGAAFPRGLAGTVTALATQSGGLVTATVAPTELDDVLQGVSVASAGPVGSSPITYAALRPSAFTCTDTAGDPRRMRGVLHLALSNLSHRFVVDPATGKAIAWVRYDAALTGTVTAPGDLRCELRQSWADVNRKDLALSGAGLSVSLVPVAGFTTSAPGTFTVSQKTTRMVGIADVAGQVRPVDARKNLGQSASAANSSTTLRSTSGVVAQLAMLDRTGLQATALLGATAQVTPHYGPSRPCVALATTATYAADSTLGLWLSGAEAPSQASSTPYSTSSRCTTPVTPVAADQGPSIVPDRLADALDNTAYSRTLATPDKRAGTWAVVDGSLPTGLTLDEGTGLVHGTPTARVGDHAFTVRFTGADGRRVGAVVRLYVGPESSVGGGDFQATLTWGDESDLDLHVTEPSGYETYYEHHKSPTGGLLDRDSNADCRADHEVANPVENIFWKPGQAPTGTYRVHVVRYDACGTETQPWHLVVRAYGRVVLDKTGSFTSSDGDDSAPTYDVTLGGGAARAATVR